MRVVHKYIESGKTLGRQRKVLRQHFVVFIIVAKMVEQMFSSLEIIFIVRLVVRCNNLLLFLLTVNAVFFLLLL